jgi:hypothetical protein
MSKQNTKLNELLKVPMDHIDLVWERVEACKTKDEVTRVLNLAPGMFGDFSVEFLDRDSGFTVTNTYFDGQLNDYYEEDKDFDYPEDWEDEYEEEEDNE